jgi:uncharacterized protein YndB with AHSA1/START domain
MKWILVGVAALALVAALVALVGSRLPRDHVAAREVRLPVPPEVVWRTITDVDAYPAWRSDVSRVERLPDRNGLPAWVEHGSSGKLTLAIERLEPPKILVVRIADPDLPFGGAWTYEVTPAPGGSVLAITERGEIYNPVFRFMARFVFGYEATLAGYAKAVEARLQSGARS